MQRTALRAAADAERLDRHTHQGCTRSDLQLVVAQFLSVGAVQVVASWWLKSRLENSVKHEYDRRLEEFKSKETLAVEIAKRRVAALADAWSKIALYEAACWQQSKAIAERLLAEARNRGAIGIPEELPIGHFEIFNLLLEHMTIGIPEAFMVELKRQVAPNQTKLLTAAEEVDLCLTSNRFWIGAPLDEEMRGYADEFKEAFFALGASEGERREFVRRLRIVSEKRWDSRSLLKRLENVSQ